MKFKVMGHSRVTGQKMVLEMEALSKGDAEKKGKAQGLNITHIEVADADDASLRGEGWRPTKVRRRPRLWLWILILVVLAVGGYLVWPHLTAYF